MKLIKISKKRVKTPDEESLNASQFAIRIQKDYKWNERTIRSKLIDKRKFDPILYDIFSKNEVEIKGKTYTINGIDERLKLAYFYLGPPPKPPSTVTTPDEESLNAKQFAIRIQKDYKWNGQTIRNKLTDKRKFDPILYDIFSKNEVEINGETYTINNLKERLKLAYKHLGPPPTPPSKATTPDEESLNAKQFAIRMQKDYKWKEKTIRNKLIDKRKEEEEIQEAFDPILYDIFSKNEVEINGETYTINNLKERLKLAYKHLGPPPKPPSTVTTPDEESLNATQFARRIQKDYKWKEKTIRNKLIDKRKFYQFDQTLYNIFSQKEVEINGETYTINGIEERLKLANDYLNQYTDDKKISIHNKGGDSRSWHEVVIRDILFFSNIDFIYEPWYNLEETQEKAPTVKDKTYEEIFESIKGAAKEFNLKRDENGKPIPVLDENGKPVVDPETGNIKYKRKEVDEEEHTAYENRKPSPDFLINGSLYFEVFGWSGESYELKKEFKKDQFYKLLEDFKYIEIDALNLAASSRSLKAYAEVLDTKVCIPCGEKKCPCNSNLGLSVLSKLITVAPLFEASGRNISLIDSYINHMSQYVEYVDDKPQETEQLEKDREFFNQNIQHYWNWYNKYKQQKYEAWKQDFIAKHGEEPSSDDEWLEKDSFIPTQQEINQFLNQPREASSSNWYKISQTENFPEPLTIQQIGQQLVSKGYWTANLWSAEDKVAAYFKTPEALTQALRSLGVQVDEEPVQREVPTAPVSQERAWEPVLNFNLSKEKMTNWQQEQVAAFANKIYSESQSKTETKW